MDTIFLGMLGIFEILFAGVIFYSGTDTRSGMGYFIDDSITLFRVFIIILMTLLICTSGFTNIIVISSIILKCIITLVIPLAMALTILLGKTNKNSRRIGVDPIKDVIKPLSIIVSLYLIFILICSIL